MSKPTGGDRRTFVAHVRQQIERRLTVDLAEHGFRVSRRESAYVRERDGVDSQFSLGIASRPPALGHTGILVEPGLLTRVPAWTADAERRLASEADPWLRAEVPSFAVWELLDWLMPGKRPHWTLPDVPADDAIDALAVELHAAATDVVLPFFDRLDTPERVLDAVEGGTVRLLQQARFTVACGALLRGRADLAAAVIAPIGLARREQLERVLGLQPAPSAARVR